MSRAPVPKAPAVAAGACPPEELPLEEYREAGGEVQGDALREPAARLEDPGAGWARANRAAGAQSV